MLYDMKSITERMEAHPERPARVLNAVTSLMRVGDSDLAELCGWSRQTAFNKRTGATKVKAADIPHLANALGIPIDRFFEEDAIEAAARTAREQGKYGRVGEVTGALLVA